MRKILTLFIVIIILIAGSPFVMAYVAKNKLEKLITKIKSSQGYDIQLTNYHIGYLHSSADLVFKITNPNLLKSIQDIKAITHGEANVYGDYVIHEKISNGPLFKVGDHWVVGIAYIDHEFPINPFIQTLFKMFSANGLVIKGDTLIKLNGDYEINFDNKPLNFDYNLSNEGIEIHYGGIKFNLNLANKFQANSFNFQFLPLSVKIPSNTFSTSGLSAVGKWYRDKNNIWSGESELTLPFIKFVGDNINFDLSKLMVTTKGEAINNKYNFIIQSTLAQLDYNNSKFSNANYLFSLKGLNAKIFDSLSKEMRIKLNQAKSSYQQKQILANILLENINALEQGSELNFVVKNFQVPDGQVNVALHAVIAEPVSFNVHNKKEFDTAINGLMKKVHAELVITIPVKFLTQLITNTQNINDSTKIEKELDQYVQQGILAKNDGYYRINAVYDLGKLTVNGKLFS